MNKKFDRIVIGIAIIVFAITPAVYSLDIRVLWAVILDLGEISIVAMASVFTGFLSVLIAGFSLWLSKQADKRNEKQARLLVQPYLTVLRHSGGNRHKIILTNYGVGPAIIKSFELLYNDKSVSLNSSVTYKKFLTKKMEEFTDKRTSHRGPNSAIKTGEEIILWEFKYNRNQNIKDMQKLVLRIEYQSIYKDEVFIYDTIENRKFIEQNAT